ncbi:ferrochelatase [Kangiella sediminilitoris]|uniref:Ferrochelatase n=1 Tax=Kangiella sediminilitoris TaxID=1144748 RepID=A0A1B3BB55_9GAMM|nr:ferrochelatase [Kangiella sediminilitoris]AOE50025.1 ferrochelatase [Kangiella sediminilitoris]
MKKQGVLLCNLGTPDEPTTQSVRRYLGEFLHDKRVVSISRWIWCLILHGIILRTRPQKVAKLYRQIWTKEGSPLLAITQKQRKKLQNEINDRFIDQRYGKHVPVEIAMAYGNPSIADGLQALKNQGCERVIVLPLYPQYSSATTASIFDRIAKYYKNEFFVPEISYVGDYHSHPHYIHSLAQSVRKFRERHGESEKLLFSYHGVPQRFSDNGDPYEKQCRNTTALVVKELGLSEDDYAISFQSRFGKEEWVKPYTDELLTEWAKEGVESVQVISPAFSADCLETLEELAVENRDTFLENGGSEYQYIPALNDDKAHIELMLQLIEQRLLN